MPTERIPFHSLPVLLMQTRERGFHVEGKQTLTAPPTPGERRHVLAWSMQKSCYLSPVWNDLSRLLLSSVVDRRHILTAGGDGGGGGGGGGEGEDDGDGDGDAGRQRKSLLFPRGRKRGGGKGMETEREMVEGKEGAR